MKREKKKGREKFLPFDVTWWLKSSRCLKQSCVANWREAGILVSTDLLESGVVTWIFGRLYLRLSGNAAGIQTACEKFWLKRCCIVYGHFIEKSSVLIVFDILPL
jgi:hypothetical protein